MLEITNLHATVAGKPILNGLTLTIPAGEIHAIMGPNGAVEAQKLLEISLEGSVG